VTFTPFGFPSQPRGIAPAAARREHEVAFVVGGKQVAGVTDYTISVGVLDAADSFQLSVPFDREVWRLVRPDRPIKIMIDGTIVIDGFLDSRRGSSQEGTIDISGRDRVGRLVQESAPAVHYQGKLLTQLVYDLAQPWFQRVVLSNARNRRVLRSKNGKKSSRLAADRGKVWLDSKVGSHTDPGQLRWSIIEELCEQAGYICWSSGDGVELIIGKPDYEQEIQYHFFQAPYGGTITQPTTKGLIDLIVEDSTADRYSRILVLGAGPGTDANYGPPTSSRSGEAKNNPNSVHGEGVDFSAPKQLIVANRNDVKSRADAEIAAKREMARRDLHGHAVTLSCATHGQETGVAGDRILFVVDTMAYIQDDDREVKGAYWLAACSYNGNRTSGETTHLTFLRKGSEVAL
jgi:prophage tail gpP-like protein